MGGRRDRLELVPLYAKALFNKNEDIVLHLDTLEVEHKDSGARVPLIRPPWAKPPEYNKCTVPLFRPVIAAGGPAERLDALSEITVETEARAAGDGGLDAEAMRSKYAAALEAKRSEAVPLQSAEQRTGGGGAAGSEGGAPAVRMVDSVPVPEGTCPLVEYRGERPLTVASVLSYDGRLYSNRGEAVTIAAGVEVPLDGGYAFRNVETPPEHAARLRKSLRDSFRCFDAQDAECFKREDRVALQGVVKRAFRSFEQFNTLVRSFLTESLPPMPACDGIQR